MKFKLFFIVLSCFIAGLNASLEKSSAVPSYTNLEQAHHQYRVAVAGSSYVGLVVGASLADMGHSVHCVDIIQEKIDSLNAGIIPIYEPGLSELVKKNKDAGRLSFSTKVQEAFEHADIIFLAVGTPMRADGSADISAVLAVTQTIAAVLQDNIYRVICIKSTVPIGTAEIIKATLAKQCDTNCFDVVSNPEFLREGCAIQDFMEPERIVVGVDSQRAQKIVEELYEPLKKRSVPFLVTNNTTAETIKYASNGFLAVKISYINEIANLCEKTGANVFDVARGMGMDSRIGNKFLTPGPGFGGSCFPKDTNALLKKAEQEHVELRVVRAALDANAFQKKHVITKLCTMIGDDLSGKTIAILGLAFKANTDDVRESAAIDVITGLREKGALIRAYDPLATENMKKIIPDICYVSSSKEALESADAAIILTEWDEFRSLDIPARSRALPILDTRNILGGK